MAMRIVLGLVAVVVLATSIVLGAAAGWLWTTFADPRGAVRDLSAIPSPAPMIIVDVAEVGAQIPLGLPGRIELAVRAAQPVSVLAGPTPDIDRLVFGAPYDVATLVDGDWTVTTVAGVHPMAPVPPDEALTAVSGDPAVLDIAEITPGSIVITKGEGDTSEVSLELRYVVADAAIIAVIGAGIAILLLLVAGVLLWTVVFAMRSRGRHE